MEVIDADIVIMKIDIEGYECKVDITHITSNQKYVWIIVKALQPEILMNKRGKFIPFIFIEWGTLYTRQEAVCPEYNDWVQLFVKGGYQPANAGMLYLIHPYPFIYLSYYSIIYLLVLLQYYLRVLYPLQEISGKKLM